MIVSKKKKESGIDNPFEVKWPSSGGDKLVGAYIPRKEANYLNLLALYSGTTVSQLIRERIAEVINTGVSEKKIIDVLAGMALEGWKSRLSAKKDQIGWTEKVDLIARWREYQQEMRLLLVKRRISEVLIIKIIRRLELMSGGI